MTNNQSPLTQEDRELLENWKLGVFAILEIADEKKEKLEKLIDGIIAVKDREADERLKLEIHNLKEQHTWDFHDWQRTKEKDIAEAVRLQRERCANVAHSVGLKPPDKNLCPVDIVLWSLACATVEGTILGFLNPESPEQNN